VQFFGHFHGGVITALADQAGCRARSVSPTVEVFTKDEKSERLCASAEPYTIAAWQLEPDEKGLARRSGLNLVRGRAADVARKGPPCAMLMSGMMPKPVRIGRCRSTER
jgi:hypothetical protein